MPVRLGFLSPAGFMPRPRAPTAVACVAIAVMCNLAAGPATAQFALGAFGNNKSDQNLPVSVEANVLEIFRDQRQAVFTGNVFAVRGEVRLRSQKLVLHFIEKKSGTGKTKTEVTRMNAYGAVVVVKGNMRATGQWAVMHMRTGKVTMGDSVVLTEDKTVIRGSKLELDLKTGKSRIIGTKNKKGKSRVFGIFVPNPAKSKKP